MTPNYFSTTLTGSTGGTYSFSQASTSIDRIGESLQDQRARELADAWERVVRAASDSPSIGWFLNMRPDSPAVGRWERALVELVQVSRPMSMMDFYKMVTDLGFAQDVPVFHAWKHTFKDLPKTRT